MNEVVLYDVDGAVATVTINNPSKRGALSLDVMSGLIEVFTEIEQLPSVHVVILKSEGKIFSAGHDLSEVRGADLAKQREIFGTASELMLLIQRIPQPVIAQVHGLATAAGCQLVATCDLVVASEEASFATPGVKIGLFCSTPMVALTRATDRKTAMKMLLTGEPITAKEARQQGLVSHVVPADALEAETRRIADLVAGFSSATVATGKGAFYQQAEMATEAAYEYTLDVVSNNAVAPDAQEGISAFFDKRAPNWRDRS